MRDKLDKIDRRIIYELDRNCRIPETRLAKMVGRSKESVRYRIRKLRGSGAILRFTTYLDLTRVGFEAYKLYIHAREKPKLMSQFLSCMKSRPDVFWVGAGDGAFDIGLTFYVKGKVKFFKDKTAIFSRFGQLVASASVGSVVETYAFGKKFLVGDSLDVKPSQVFGGRGHEEIDGKDMEILRCLIEDGRMAYVSIAPRVRLSPESVRTRIKDLEKKKIISRYTIEIDSEKLGYEFYKTFIYFEGLVKEEDRRLFEIARRHPNVLNFLRVLAPWDVELEIMAENYHHYNKIINYFREQFPDSLVKVETTVLQLDEINPSKDVPSPY